MTTTPVFNQDGTLGIFWLSGAPSIAYLPSRDAAFTGQITLDQAWADRLGVYLFLDQRPANMGATLDTLRAYIQRLGIAGQLRMLWLTTANLAPSAWRACALHLSGQRLGQTTIVNFAPHSLLIGEGSTVQLATQDQGWGFILTPSSGACSIWQNENGQWPLRGDLIIPFSGASCGCLTGQLAVPNFTSFGAGLAYFYEETVEAGLPAVNAVAERIRTGYAQRLQLPLFKGGLDGTLSVSLDPCQPLDINRTCLTLPAGASAPSYLVSPRGHAVALTALADQGSGGAARLVFQAAPFYTASDAEASYLHIVPQGSFAVTVTPPQAVLDKALAQVNETPPWTPVERLLCGMSGVEYLGLPVASGCRMVFCAGYPAFAPGAAQGVLPLDNRQALTSLNNGRVATTAWVSVLPPQGQATQVNYFSQPEQAPLYGSNTGLLSASSGLRSPATAQGFLHFTELPSATVGTAETALTYPLAPYTGLAPAQLEAARRVEAVGIAPARRQAINLPQALNESRSTTTRSVTPQGLVVDWDASTPSIWSAVVFAHDIDPVSGTNNLLQFTRVSGPLRTVLQTNRLFMVGARPDVFATGGSVAYGPGADTFAGLIAAAPTDPVYQQLSNWYKTNHYPVDPDEAAFKSRLEQLSGITVDAPHFEALRRVSGLLRAEISGWHFQFSPWSWTCANDQALPGMLVVMKFTPGKLSELAGDPATWAWPAVASFGGSPLTVRDKLLGLINDARERQRAAGHGSSYDHFIHQVVDNPYWSGVLILDCPIPLTELPGPLQCLAAGIDPSRFAAHHIGFNATAFQVGSQGIELSQTSMFGLIDYRDDVELHLDPTPDASFAYKVQRLTVEFANSAIRGFSARVALLAPQLFASTLTLRDTVRGNSLLMDGMFQKPPNTTSDAEGSYVFRIVEESLYDASDSVISTIDVRSAEFLTLAPADPADPAARVHAQFRLGGRITFKQFSDFDVLSYGPGDAGSNPDSCLEFDSLLINLSFALYPPKMPPTFSEDATKLTTVASSVPRTQSLMNRFPIRLVGLTGVPQEGAQTPADLGYVAADTPLENTRLATPWWGLVYAIDLGTGGALSNGSSFNLTLLAAWNKQGPRDEAPPLSISVRMPGLKDLVGASLPFESFLRLGFRNIKFSAYDDSQGNRAYVLRLRRFSIGALGISFPPANMDVLLFGNPNGDKSKVGWYAAYAADQDDKKNRQANSERLRLAAHKGVFGRT